MKLSKLRLLTVLAVSFGLIFSVQAFAKTLSGSLDTYSGTGFSDVGQISVDSFSISDTDFYTNTQITASQRWPGTYAGITLIPMLKSGSGYSAVSGKSNSFTATSSTGYVTQSFTGLTSGTYKIYFQSQFQENGLNFNGTVYNNYN